MAKAKTPNEIVATFRAVLKEASRLLKKPQNQITKAQFLLLAGGRLGTPSMDKLGGFAVLREYIAPSSKAKALSEAASCLERILKNVKAA